MAFMKKNINFGLMLIILAVLVGFTGFSIYYQMNYLKLANSYKLKQTDLTDALTKLQNERSQLNQTSFQLQIKEEASADLGTKYTILKSQKEQLDTDKAKLQSDVSQKNQKILELTSDISNLQVNIATVQTKLDTANNQISGLQSDVSAWKSKARCWEDRAALSDDQESTKSC